MNKLPIGIPIITCIFALQSFLVVSAQQSAETQNPSSPVPAVWINQVGYFPKQAKWAVVANPQASTFQVVDLQQPDRVLLQGSIDKPELWEPLGEAVSLIDFSTLQESGSYILKTDAGDRSFPILVKDNALREVAAAAIRALYLSRASIEITPEHAGKWARPAGHPDTEVMIHSSAASEARPEGTLVSAPKGWYDAGDYNKYVVNSGISTYTLLLAYRMNPEFYGALDLNIPESGNDLPDILDEIKWNLDWMLEMQDPNDGGVYHKLSTLHFEPAVLPHLLSDQRYMIGKTTGATCNFAAVMAFASRIWSPFDPEYANRCLEAARKAWSWIENNPDLIYQQPEDVRTGTYGDRDLTDERLWAATELYLSTGEPCYFKAVADLDPKIEVPSWNSVALLAHYSLAIEKGCPASIAKIRKVADHEISLTEASPARIGMVASDFIWGSNAVAANKSMALLIAYRLTGEDRYFAIGMDKLNYLLGKNPTGYCFVTGFGAKPVMNPHYRPSMGDDLVDPHPGFLSGGPNHNRQDALRVTGYLGDTPALAFIDEEASYATNEIAINWNAPLAFITGMVEAVLEKTVPE